jgi:hypothetical protein
MRYIVGAILDEEEQTNWECKTLPLVPNIGDWVTLNTQDGSQWGKVKRRSFVYSTDKAGRHTCYLYLTCDRVTKEDVE